MNYLQKHFSEKHGSKFFKSFFLSPTNENEISNIKSFGPNSILQRLLNYEISSHLSDIYDSPFFSWVYFYES